MNIAEALKMAKQRIAPVSDTASLEAQVLLADVLDVNRAYVLSYGERDLTPAEQAHYESLIERASQGEPLPYIRGKQAFYDVELIVTPDVLIPRPETELLLERVLVFPYMTDKVINAVDVGTGSGALAVTFAKHVPQAHIYAVDMSVAALDIARRNAEKYDVADRITFLQGDLLTPLIERQILSDIIMANLPYIASDEVPTLAVSRYEPTLALDGGADGLDLIRRLLWQVEQVCPQLILLEIGAGQGERVAALAQHLGTTEVLHDYAGHDRIVEIMISRSHTAGNEQ